MLQRIQERRILGWKTLSWTVSFETLNKEIQESGNL